MFTTILVDDESCAIANLRRLITENAPELEIIGTSTDPAEAAELINTKRPDVVFIDIEMPGLNGFQLLEQIRHRSFFVVFCTAYSHYGIAALRANAIDYLMKPVDTRELRLAIARMVEKSHIKLTDFEHAVRLIFESRNADRKIPLPKIDNVDYVDDTQLALIEADLKNSRVTLSNGNVQSVNKSLKDYEELLCHSARNFMRVHNSFIVNLDHVWRYVKSDGHLVVNPGRLVPVSKQRREAVLAALGITALGQ